MARLPLMPLNVTLDESAFEVARVDGAMLDHLTRRGLRPPGQPFILHPISLGGGRLQRQHADALVRARA